MTNLPYEYTSSDPPRDLADLEDQIKGTPYFSFNQLGNEEQ